MSTASLALAAAASAVCPLCGHTAFADAFGERGYRLRRCTRCDLFSIHPYPTPAELAARVASYAYEDFDVIDPDGAFTAQAFFYRSLWPTIRPFFLPARTVLDVGAGAGNLLSLVREASPLAMRFGVELNHQRADYLRRRTSAQIFETSILDLPEDRTYDAIALINVFAHVPAAPLMQKLAALMHADSHLVVRVTEMKDSVARSDVHDWEIPDHIQFPGMRTFETAARRFGMRIVFHQRTPIAEMIFTRDRFAAPGKSRLRNTLKRAALLVPGFLPAARAGYTLLKGERLYSSVIVLRKA